MSKRKQSMEATPESIVPHRAILMNVPSGQIVMESGDDGAFLRFECSCDDALPYCKAACCALAEISVTQEEADVITDKHPHNPPLIQITPQDSGDPGEMRRGSNGYCMCNDALTKRCAIYEDRPATCSSFHCTIGPGMRGFRLDLTRLDD